MIRNDQMIAIVFNVLNSADDGAKVYKAFNTEKGEFINLIAERDIQWGSTVALNEGLSTPEEKMPRYTAGDTIDFDSLQESEQDYVREIIDMHTKRMQHFEDCAGCNGLRGKLRAALAGKPTKDAYNGHYRAKPQAQIEPKP